MSLQPSAVRLTLKSISRIAQMMKVSGCKPDVLTLLSTPIPKTSAAFNGLTLSRILTADVGVKSPRLTDARTTLFDILVLVRFVRLLANEGRLVDANVFLIKNTNLLKTRIYCQFFVDKKFEPRLEVCDKQKRNIRRCSFFIFDIFEFCYRWFVQY